MSYVRGCVNLPFMRIIFSPPKQGDITIFYSPLLGELYLFIFIPHKRDIRIITYVIKTDIIFTERGIYETTSTSYS